MYDKGSLRDSSPVRAAEEDASGLSQQVPMIESFCLLGGKGREVLVKKKEDEMF